MSPLFAFSSRQQALLKLLLQNPAGTSTDELTILLGISRNATNQHLSSLGNLDLIQHDLRPSRGGRPIKNYRLSPRGQELFPRHYDLFARMLIDWIRHRLDENNLKQGLRDMGVELASHYRDRVDALGGLPLKISETATILTEMGYEADTSTTDDGASDIIARNCVFHQLAGQCKQVCELDLSLIGTLLNARIEHQECIVDGASCCRFGITPE
jgi:DeoR family suf operon transcriptional repressor